MRVLFFIILNTFLNTVFSQTELTKSQRFFDNYFQKNKYYFPFAANSTFSERQDSIDIVLRSNKEFLIWDSSKTGWDKYLYEYFDSTLNRYSKFIHFYVVKRPFRFSPDGILYSIAFLSDTASGFLYQRNDVNDDLIDAMQKVEIFGKIEKEKFSEAFLKLICYDNFKLMGKNYIFKKNKKWLKNWLLMSNKYNGENKWCHSASVKIKYKGDLIDWIEINQCDLYSTP